jgi:hypothetical protein
MCDGKPADECTGHVSSRWPRVIPTTTAPALPLVVTIGSTAEAPAPHCETCHCR